MKTLSCEDVNLLRYNARSVVRELGLLNDAYFDIDVTLAERHLLIELTSCLYPTVSEIAKRLLLDKSTASRLIAKAVNKGYIKYTVDENDKRRRFLQLTEAGKEVLSAFEPIAFKQTEAALLTLTAEEIETVYRGIALYAQGLKTSRLRNKVAIEPMTQHDHAGLAHLHAATHKGKDIAAWSNLCESYQKKGCRYLVMKMDSKIVGGAGITPYHAAEGFSCELGKICLQADMHDLGFSKLLINACIQAATSHGYDQCYVDPVKETCLSKEFFQELGFQCI